MKTIFDNTSSETLAKTIVLNDGNSQFYKDSELFAIKYMRNCRMLKKEKQKKTETKRLYD